MKPDEPEVVETTKKRTSLGRKKIEIKYIEDKTRRKQTFRKRALGLFKKAYELHMLTNSYVKLVIHCPERNIELSYDSNVGLVQPMLPQSWIDRILSSPTSSAGKDEEDDEDEEEEEDEEEVSIGSDKAPSGGRDEEGARDEDRDFEEVWANLESLELPPPL